MISLTRPVLIAFAATSMIASAAAAQVSTVDLTTSDGGFTTQSLSGQSPWQWSSGTGWYNAGSTSVSLQRLLTPVLVATETAVVMSFNHVFGFEGSSPCFDGGQIRASINGGAFTLLSAISLGYTGTVDNSNLSPIAGQRAYCGSGGGLDGITGVFAVGTTMQFAFDGAWDRSISAPGVDWAISSVTYQNLRSSTVPEPSTYFLMATGLAGLGVVARRKRRSAAR